MSEQTVEKEKKCCSVFLLRRLDSLLLKSKLGEKIHKDMTVGELTYALRFNCKPSF